MQRYDIVVNRVAYSGCEIETAWYLAVHLDGYLDSQSLDQESRWGLSPVAIDVPKDIKSGDVTCQVFLRLRDPSLDKGPKSDRYTRGPQSSRAQAGCTETKRGPPAPE